MVKDSVLSSIVIFIYKVVGLVYDELKIYDSIFVWDVNLVEKIGDLCL